MVEKFRRDVRTWLENNAPRALFGTGRHGAFEGYWGGQKTPDPGPDQRHWLALMADRGWTAPTWPKPYGGGGLLPEEGRVVQEEILALGLPPPLVGLGLAMLGPVLLEFGTEAQKKTHLPKICDGSIRWCQGYSEPSSGSDLASLSTRAIRHGDHFVVNGQKVWTSYADLSDWIFCLVRTNPDVKKQAGITFLLINMSTPGISTRRIQLISGASPFCETFFEEVRVPMAHVVHEVDKGWTVAKSLLGHERSTIGVSISHQMSDIENDLLRKARRGEGRRPGAAAESLSDPTTRDRIAECAMREKALDLTVARLSREPLGARSSMLKVVGSELKQRRWELAMELMGHDGWLWNEADSSATDVEAPSNWLRTRATTIEGGTTEIQLNIIARHLLGLPS